MTPVKKILRLLSLALVALAVAAAAGCGGGSNGGGSSGGGGGGGSSALPAGASDADIQALYKGNYQPPPTSAPKPQPGKKIWLISCGQSISSCAIAIGGAKEAAESMGWNARIFDTKGDPGTANTAIRQALAAKADGIFVWYVDCSYMRQGLQEAKAAGVPVVGAEVYDCNEVNKGAPKLFTAEVKYVQGDYNNWIQAWGKAQADYLLNKIKGKGSILFFGDDTSLGSKRAELGFVNVVKQCGGCKYRVKRYSFGELVAGVQSQTEQELLRTPDASAVGVAYDGVLLAGVSAGVLSSNRNLKLMVGEGGTAAMALVRQHKAEGGVGIPVDWEGFGGIDALNRIFHGQKPVPSGIGVQVFDQTHNLPASGGYKAPFDFKALYKKAWGVGG
jgi:ribose transport system substrate-binding protein